MAGKRRFSKFPNSISAAGKARQLLGLTICETQKNIYRSQTVFFSFIQNVYKQTDSLVVLFHLKQFIDIKTCKIAFLDGWFISLRLSLCQRGRAGSDATLFGSSPVSQPCTLCEDFVMQFCFCVFPISADYEIMN